MIKVLHFTIVLTTIFCLFPTIFTLPDGETPAANTTVAPIKEKVDIMASKLCSKCICDKTLSQIDCSNKLEDWFSAEEWGLLQNGDVIFETVVLSHNNITNIPVLPTYGLKNLYLDNNNISSIALGAFQNLTQITKLDLSHNKLNSKILVPDVFKGPYSAQDYEPIDKLISINLGYNLIHSLNDDLFEHVPHLQELSLCANSFIVIDKLTETALSSLSSLQILDISYMEIDSLPDTLLHGPRDLHTLIASGNLFHEIPSALEYAKNLVYLVLDENPIEDLVGDNVFPAMTNLRYLSLSYMPELYRIGPGAFSELQNLTELILSGNMVLAEIDSNALSKNVTGGNYLDYPPLEKLYLNNGNLTILPRDLIVRWDKLAVLDLRFNPWICDQSNEYLITYLIKHVNKTVPNFSASIACGYPENLKGVTLLKVSNDNMLPASSGTSIIWLSFLIVLLVILIALTGLMVYRRGYCGLGRKREIQRRALYNRTSFTDDFHI